MSEFISKLFPTNALKSIVSLSTGNVIVFSSGFLYSVFSAWILGAQQLGALLLVISAVRLITTPFRINLKKPLIKLLSQKRSEKKSAEVFQTFLTGICIQTATMAVFGLVFLVFLVGIVPFWPIYKRWQTALGLFALSEIINNIRLVLIPYLLSLERYGLKAFYSSIQSLFRDFIPVYFMFTGVTAACFGYLLAEIILVLSTVVLFLKWEHEVSLKVVKDLKQNFKTLVSEVYQHARSHYASSLLNATFAELQSIIIGSFINRSAVSFYKYAFKFRPLLKFLRLPLNQYLSPRFVEKWENNKSEFFYTLRKYFYVSIPSFSLLGALVILSAPYLIPWIYGKEFFPAVSVVYIITPALVLNNIFSPLQQLLIVITEAREIFNSALVKFCVGIPSLLILTTYYSYIGTAWAFSISIYAMIVYYIIILFKLFGNRWIK